MFEWFKNLGAKKENPVVPQVNLHEAPQETPITTFTNVTTFTNGFIVTQDGISLVLWGTPHSIGKSHINYNAILEALRQEDYALLEDLVDVPSAIKNQTKGLVVVNEYGEVYYNDAPVHNVIADRISIFVRERLPFEPLARFLENLMQNPNPRSVEQLYSFLEHGGFPITHDGCFLAYKGVTDDFKDCHTRSFDNKVGAINSMPRDSVDSNPDAACSVGFHVGTHAYASGFSQGNIVMVKVNPRDAVSVPHDHSCEKLRVCEYKVVEICTGKVLEPLYEIGRKYNDPQEELDELEEVVFEDYEDDLLDKEEDGDYRGGVGMTLQGSGGNTLITNTTFPGAVVQAPKRPACKYCGAKGGKKHKKSCRRPKKS